MHHKKDKKKEDPTTAPHEEDDAIEGGEGSQKAKEESTSKGSRSSFFRRWKKDKKKEVEEGEKAETEEAPSQKEPKKSKKKDKENVGEEEEEEKEKEEPNKTPATEGDDNNNVTEGDESRKSEKRKKKKHDPSTDPCEEDADPKKTSRRDHRKKRHSANEEEEGNNEEVVDEKHTVANAKEEEKEEKEEEEEEEEQEKEKREEENNETSHAEEEEGEGEENGEGKKKKSHRRHRHREADEAESQGGSVDRAAAPDDIKSETAASEKKSHGSKDKSHRRKKESKESKKSKGAASLDEDVQSEEPDDSSLDFSIVEVSEKPNKKKKDKGQSATAAVTVPSASMRDLSTASNDTPKSKRKPLKLGSQSCAEIPSYQQQQQQQSLPTTATTSAEDITSEAIVVSTTPTHPAEPSQEKPTSSSTSSLPATPVTPPSSSSSSSDSSAAEQQIIFKPAPAFTPVVATSSSSTLLQYGLFGRKLPPSKPQKSMSGWTQCRALQKVCSCDIEDKESPIRVLRWSKSGEFLASGNKKGNIYIWKRSQPNEGSVINRDAFAVLVGHTADVLSIDWFDNGNLISGSSDNTAIIWTLSNKISMNEPGDFVTYKNEFASLKHDNSVTSVATCPSNKDLVLTGCLDNTIRLWNLNSGNGKTAPVPTILYNVKEPVNCIAFSPDSSVAIVGTTEGNVLFCSTKDFVLERKLSVASVRGKKSKDAITGFSFRAREPEFLVSSTDGCIRLYDFKTLKLRKFFKGVTNTKTLRMHADFSDNGTYIVCGSEDKSIYVWNTNKPGEASPDTEKEILYGESFRSSLDKMTFALFVPRLPSEKEDVMEGRFIVGADRLGFVTVYENPKLFFIDDEATDDDDDDSDDSDSDSDDSSDDDDDDEDASESVCDEPEDDN